MELVIWFGIATILFFCIEWMIRQIKISDFKRRYVLVTGCDSGFGNVAAKKLDHMGFKVFACCLTKVAVKEINESGSTYLKAIEMDVTKDTSIEKAMEIVQRHLPENKGLWAVVNNAGIVGALGSTRLHTKQDYENTLAVNLYGVIMVTQACMPLIQKEKGRIINTSSVLGRLGMINTSYCVSKYGVKAFSDVLRRELYKTGVKISIVEPGAFTPPIFNKEAIRRKAEAKMASLPADTRATLPNDAVEQLGAALNKVGLTGSTQIHHVPDAYIHALQQDTPRKGFKVNVVQDLCVVTIRGEVEQSRSNLLVVREKEINKTWND